MTNDALAHAPTEPPPSSVSKRAPQPISRKDAARFINEVLLAFHRVGVAEDEGQMQARVANLFAIVSDEARKLAVPEPVPCSGQAHAPDVGGMIDNCTVCAPHWGEIFHGVKVK